MTAGAHRHGRRDNGLHATAYAVAGDVDPRVGEHLLDVLGLAGIAAYLQPTADLHPVTRTTTLPSRPIDRLYVDRDHLDEAREYLDKLGPAAAPAAAAGEDPTAAAAKPAPDPTAPEPAPAPEPPADPARADADVDAAWAAIVAQYDRPAESPIPPWPVAEDLAEEPAPRAAPDDTPPAGTVTRRPATDWRAERDGPDLLDQLDAEEDEGYEPPPPPPLPRPSWYAAVAVVGIALGLVLCIRPDLVGFIGLGEGGGLALGFGCLLAGFVTLVIRLRPGDDEDDDSDDGAVV